MICIAATTDTFSKYTGAVGPRPPEALQGPKTQSFNDLAHIQILCKSLVWQVWQHRIWNVSLPPQTLLPIYRCTGPRSCKKNPDTCKHSAIEVCMASLETQGMYVFQAASDMKRARCYYGHATSSLHCMLDMAHQKLQSAPIPLNLLCKIINCRISQ